jgi:hypothetical protein
VRGAWTAAVFDNDDFIIIIRHTAVGQNSQATVI